MPGTSSHTIIRLSGKGVKKVEGYGSGDHYINFKVVVPKTLDKKQKALVQAFAELEKDTPGQIFGITHKTDGEDKLFKKACPKEEVRFWLSNQAKVL